MIDDPTNAADPVPELDALSRSIEPDRAVEERVVAALRADGVLTAARPIARQWLTAAAAAALLTVGVAAGYFARPPQAPARSPDSAPRFVLLLYGEATRAGGEAEAQLVDEYRRWAQELSAGGRYVTGERLDDSVVSVGPSVVALPLRGFFVVSAADFDEAVALARGCPHAARGGQIIVRPIA
jgi:hypothetical protein